MNELIQDTTEWLEFRKKHIGASDVAAILGVSPYRTAQQLFDEKLGNIPAQKENIYMRRGKELEEEARCSFEELTGLVVFPRVIVSTEYPWLLASLDGMDIEGENIVEIKCPGCKDHLIAKSGDVPEKYYPQLQQQMLVTGFNQCYYYSYSPYEPDGNILLSVSFDEEFCINLIEKTKRFWGCMQTGELTEEFKNVRQSYKDKKE